MKNYSLKKMMKKLDNDNVTLVEVETLIDELKTKSPSFASLFISIIALVLNLITTWVSFRHKVLAENITVDHGSYMQKRYGIQQWKLVDIISRDISRSYNIITSVLVISSLILIVLIVSYIVKANIRDKRLLKLYEYKRYLLSKQTSKIKS